MQSRSRKITYSALAAAIAVCCMLLSQFVMLKTPLFVCALCFYFALDKCGLVYGLLSMLASILLTLLMGFLASGVLVALVFAPYGLIQYFMRRLSYNKAFHIAVRLTVAAVFANLVLALVYYLAHVIMPDVEIDKILKFVGGYFFLAIFITLFFMVTDFFFRQFCLMFDRRVR